MREISTVGIMVVYCALCSPISGAQTIDQPVKWHFTAISLGDKKATLIFTATLAEHWHIYSQIPSAHGPWPTTFTFFPGDNYSLNGIVKEQTPIKNMTTCF
jgi:thiol:disulfide interchange protein DsbD